MDGIRRAILAIRSGDPSAGIEILTSEAQQGDADCWIELGFIYLKGRLAPRNLPRSRECFGEAARLGDQRAQRIYTAMIANGAGGPSDLPAAKALLSIAAGSDPAAARQLELLETMDINSAGDPRQAPAMTVLSSRPWVASFPGLLTEAECAYLIESAEPAYQPAQVGQRASGQQGYSAVRTCEVAVFPWVAEDPVIHALNRRIAAASATDVTCGEPLQILRYRPGQEFKPHVDCTASTDNQRVLTMLVYLTEDYSGGDTEFLSTGLRFRGGIGEGLLFRNADPSTGKPDTLSRHAGLPVTAGEKIIASRWIRQRPFGDR